MPAPDATRRDGRVHLADLTTLRVGGPAARFIDATTDEAVLDAVRAADASGTPLLVVGGGSNLVVADEGFPGTVLRIGTTGIESDGDVVRAAAGEDWDGFVARMVDEGRAGVETLAGIPGRVGATPVQNVGAYGAEIAQTLLQVLAFDRRADRVVVLANEDCGFSYRHSVFKGSDRYVVLTVHLSLPVAAQSCPIRYEELARRLGIEVGGSAPLADVRAAVLDLRRSKGMVLDAADHDTWSAGSFFTNPVLTPDQAAALPAEAPRFAAGDRDRGSHVARDGDGDGQLVKTSAAWLIERAGFGKGYGTGDARLSTKHTLALTNRGHASTSDILALAYDIRKEIAVQFGITLAIEPVVVGGRPGSSSP
ncbi:MAG: UDP-N-acetylmuramate dehydrogenase [Frankiaceae bacterium]|nr:UDP-N-acetylmuramate dehydrogenase [Frankiaceae bacterium]